MEEYGWTITRSLVKNEVPLKEVPWMVTVTEVGSETLCKLTAQWYSLLGRIILGPITL